jgi:type II secretory pathway pseudopilin PulG
MRRPRAALDRQDGMTLAEVMVTMSLMMIVILTFTTVLASIQRAVSHTDSRAINNDQARLAMIELDREIRSGNVLYDPASDPNAGFAAGFVLRIYTQSNANIRTPAPGYVCRLWQVTTSGELQSRYWPPLRPEDATAWITVASGIVNRQVSPTIPAFSRSDPASATGGRIVNVTLLVNNRYATRPNETVRIQSAITGRNTSFGFPTDVCSSTPS